MLQVKDISKEYKTGSLVQKALNHVSLNLRDNEFVAILGPSGSGKTTLLNIIGGLDRYDSGDLIINGVSTKKYKDRDWDSYRNHTIGFVFQSYNLIPHQTVLANVELALTIGGISRSERKRRAMEALKKVGLGEQTHKKPSQMSGGQMQRVAIARALVNDPDILLADEPTGALDSETSIQVMDLLKEVAKDRLVVMVTHNPELAEEYATRIVRVKDGVIQSDTDPYIVEENEAVHRNFGKASMSFLTALGLSFNNLKTKLARTLLIALAGSIGITGIALILSLSNGVNKYIKGIEENTLSEYPLEITNASFDIASFMGVQVQSWRSDAEVVEMKTISNMLTKISANDLSSLQKFIDSPESGMSDYARAVEYSYNLAPEVYRIDGNKYYQVNPDTTFSQMGFNSMSMYTSGMSSNSFMKLPAESSLYMDQYDIKAGRWPENNHELVLVLSDSGRLADLTLYALGMKDQEELDAIIRAYMSGEDAEIPDTIGEYHYTDFIGLTYKLVHGCDYYQYDKDYNVWTNKKEDRRYMMQLISDGVDLTIVGVVMPKEDATVAMLSSGVYFQPSLITDSVHYAAESEIVKSQLANPDIDIISGTVFGEETDGSFSLQDLFSVDEDALQNAIQFDSSVMEMSPSDFDFSGLNFSGVDFSDLNFENMNLPEMDFLALMETIKIDLKYQDLADLFAALSKDYAQSTGGDPTLDISLLPAAIDSYLSTEKARTILSDAFNTLWRDSISDALNEQLITDALTAILEGYAQYAAENGIADFSALATYLATDEGSALLAAQAASIKSALESVSIPDTFLNELQQQLLEGYHNYASENKLPEVDAIREHFAQWMQSDFVKQRIMETVTASLDTTEFEKALAETMGGFTIELQKTLAQIMNRVMSQMTSQISYAITDAMSKMAGSMENALKIDADAFANAFKVTMTEEEVQELMAVMMTKSVTSFDSNLSKMGYIDLEKPYSITIYPKDFDSKASIKEILDGYNARMKESGQDEKVVSYTDIVGTLMSSVTDIINAISYVLVAFVAISLVVSSIMIGVITYISVLERKKEIGILRAIGASKRNISEVFNAETFIIGFLAGLIGVVGTELLLIPGNMLIHYLTDMEDISAFLPPMAGVILIALSVILTLIGGLLPSKKAAKSDPVTALRTE